MKRSDSLKRKKEFRYTYRVGKSSGNRLVGMVYARSRQPEPRIGFSVSKKIGTAVIRNRTKRRMREAVTPLIPNIRKNVNVIFIARSPIIDTSFGDLCNAMESALRKGGLLTVDNSQE